MKKVLLILSTVLAALGANATSIVFNTLGPGDTYDQNNGWLVGFSSGFKFETAAEFTAAVSGNLANIDLGLTFINNGAVNVYLYGDASGSPNTANQTFLGSGTPAAALGTTNNSIVSFAVTGTIPVTMGTNYWLVLKPAVTSEDIAWNFSSTSFGMVDQSNDDSSWFPTFVNILPAFRLTATQAIGVADSGATILLLLGSFATLIILRKRLAREQEPRVYPLRRFLRETLRFDFSGLAGGREPFGG